MAQEPALLKVTRHGGGTNGGAGHAEHGPDTVQIEFTTRKILDEANIAEIGEQLSAIVDKEERPKIIISFAAVDHLSSAALGTLIIINNKVKQKGGQLRLSNINPQIYEVFSITKLNKLFRIYPTVREAQESLQPA